MSKSKKARQVTQVRSPVVSLGNAGTLVNPKKRIEGKIGKRKPVLGMTHMQIRGSYSLSELGKSRNRDVYYKELEHLQKSAQKYDDIEDFLNAFCPKNGEIDPGKNEIIKVKLKDFLHLGIRHIHCRSSGYGTFTLFGFQLENRFEILPLDPEHKIVGK